MRGFALPAALLVFVHASLPARARGDSAAVKACTSLAEEGQRLRAAGRLLEARERLVMCSVAECPEVVRVDCAQWAGEVLASTPTIVVDAKDAAGNDVADARVFVDDEKVAERIDGRPIPIDPGPHVVRIERIGGVGRESASQSIVAKENAKGREVRIVLATSAATPAATKTEDGGWTWRHWTGIGLAVVGAVGITYSTVSYLSYRTREEDALAQYQRAFDISESCKQRRRSDVSLDCSDELAVTADKQRAYDENEADARSGVPFWLAGGIGGLLLVGGGIVLFVTAPSSSKTSVAPIVTPHFAGMTVGGTF